MQRKSAALFYIGFYVMLRFLLFSHITYQMFLTDPCNDNEPCCSVLESVLHLCSCLKDTNNFSIFSYCLSANWYKVVLFVIFMLSDIP